MHFSLRGVKHEILETEVKDRNERLGHEVVAKISELSERAPRTQGLTAAEKFRGANRPLLLAQNRRPSKHPEPEV